MEGDEQGIPAVVTCNDDPELVVIRTRGGGEAEVMPSELEKAATTA